MPVLRLLACVPGTTFERWVREIVVTATLETASPDGLVAALHDAASYTGVILLLCPRIMALWQPVRDRLVQTRTPTVVLTPLALEPLHRLAFERELRLVGLHVLGVDDHPSYVQASIDRLLREGALQRFLGRFGPRGGVLEGLVSPCWDALATTRSVDQWAALIGCGGRDLRRELHAIGVRSPRRLLTWLRLLAAWPRLQAGSPAATVALEVGYSAPPALTRSAYHFVGVLPSAARVMSLDGLIDKAEADLVA
jgi:AraC-like DNA-binding protein